MNHSHTEKSVVMTAKLILMTVKRLAGNERVNVTTLAILAIFHRQERHCL